ncbi:MAG: CHASE2 domain-containing protein [Candidatus Limnocylindria bacterium]
MFRNRKQRQRAVLALIVGLGTLLGGYLIGTKYLDSSLQSVVYDYVLKSSPAEVRNQITIVALDDATVTKYGRWPLPRQAYADLLNALQPHSPKVIAFDVGFFDPSDRPADDQALADAIRGAGNVILAMQGDGLGEYRDGALHFPVLKLPLPMFADAAAGLAAVNVIPDPDSRVREAQLIVRGPNGETFHSLALVASITHLAGDLGRATVEGDRFVVPAPLGARNMPVNEGGAMRIYYAAPPAPPVESRASGHCAQAGQFCVVSLIDVVEGKVARNLLQARSIYVGAHTLPAVPDNYPVPNSGAEKMWGVEIWANAAQSIFTNRYPVPDQGLLPTVVQILALLVAGVLLVFRLRLLGFLLALGGLAVYSFLQVVLFSFQVEGAIGNGPVSVPSIGYLVPSVFWWVVTLGYLLVEEQVAVARTQSTFGRFVTPSVARTIMDREERGGLHLGGEMREMTVLFGDIRGFTTMSEGMDAPTLLATLNRYFEGMVNIVNRYEGTVNKYNGDNIMVIWNAPVEVADHARKAVECAVELQKWIVAERAKGGPDVSFGFGINTGAAVAGFLGASGRMEYTVIGDPVNVASRLTSNDIARRDQVACSAETLQQLGEDVIKVDLGAIFVKGRGEPVRCYQIDRIGLSANPNPAPPPEIQIGKAAVAGFH